MIEWKKEINGLREELEDREKKEIDGCKDEYKKQYEQEVEDMIEGNENTKEKKRGYYEVDEALAEYFPKLLNIFRKSWKTMQVHYWK